MNKRIYTLEQKERKRLYDIEYNEKNKDKHKKTNTIYRENNKEKIKENQKLYTLNNKDKKKEYDKKYRSENIDKKKKNGKEYYQSNKSILIEKQKEYCKINKDKINARILEKKKNNPLFKLSCSTRSLIKQAFKRKGCEKLTKTELILGCSFTEFKIYIESLWQPWMNWDNKGNWNGVPTEINTSWDVDHKIPLITAKTVEDIIKLNHYTNLQPLCSYTNRHIKKNKY
jgi:hypothetical protein